MYTTTENIENKLGATLTPEQAAYLTDVLSPAIVSYIDNATNASFANVGATVYADGEGTSLLSIPTMNTITELRNENGDVIPSTEYSLYPAGSTNKIAIRHKNGTWDDGYENFTVVGNLGYADVPDDIVHVATELAINALTVNNSGLKSEKVGDWSATYADVEKSISPISMNILKSYDRLSRRI
jgi:hypothetical protein